LPASPTKTAVQPAGPDSASANAGVRVSGLTHRYDGDAVLKGVSLEVQGGEFVTLLGSSGSGKTTLLRLIGGLLETQDGRITIEGRDMAETPANKRDIGFVFQHYALFPHLTVEENVRYPLRMRRCPKQQADEQVKEALDRVQLGPLAGRHPGELSGGQQQRVALARAFVFRPSVLLLDEPLGALDKRLRQDVMVELRTLQRDLGITTIYVTHDQEEAFVMSNRVAVMDGGAIVQIGTPGEVYSRPTSPFVARFVGEVNEFRGTARPSNGHLGIDCESGQALVADGALEASPGKPVWAAIRPENLRLARADQPAPDGHAKIDAKIATLITGGAWFRAELRCPDGLELIAVGGGIPWEWNEGDEVSVSYRPADVVVIPEDPR
jgi:putative spermidine/putrescine transport system ATP-binding protein